MGIGATGSVPVWALVVVTIISFSVCSLILGIFLKRWINNAYRGWEKYEILKEEVITDWRTAYCAKLREVKGVVDEIKDELNEKVAVIEHNAIKTQVDEHGKKILILEFEVKNIKRGK